MIDCPGIVYNQEGTNDIDCVLKGTVRAEKLEDPAYYINEMLKRVDLKQINKLYGLPDKKWQDDEEFLTELAKKKGRLLKVKLYYNIHLHSESI